MKNYTTIEIDPMYIHWKEYRRNIYQEIKRQENLTKLEKTPENIYKLAKEKGIKPTARYFGVQPSQVRYYIRKIENNSTNKLTK